LGTKKKNLEEGMSKLAIKGKSASSQKGPEGSSAKKKKAN